MKPFKLSSPTDLSILLFGGVIKDRVKEPVVDADGNIVLIKSGQNTGQMKTKIVEKSIKFPGFKIRPKAAWKTKKEGVYQTNEGVLQELLKEAEGDLKALLEGILASRGIEKDIATYFEGVEDKIYPDCRIRCQYNHTGTATARLSSNKPNLQNLPRGDE